MSTPPREHVQYQSDAFDVGDLAATPFGQWQRWYADALAADVPEPDAMIVATVDDNGAPDARVVLLRDIDDRGPVFYTSYESAKSTQLDARPVAAGVVTWVTLHRQVRFRGAVERVDAHQSDAYFSTRPRGSQIGAWASPQSGELPDRDALVVLVAAAEQRFEGRDVPRPPQWGGWRILADTVEFWQGQRDRLHDRLRFERAGDTWTVTRLAP